jgi:hypothetical protein
MAFTCGFVVVADSLQADGGRPGELRPLGVEFNINLVLAASRQGSLARQANLDGKRHLTSDASYRRQVSALAICAGRSEIGQPGTIRGWHDPPLIRVSFPGQVRDNRGVRQLQLFTSAQMAVMRDRTARRNYSAEAEEFRREHARHREWGLAQRHGEKLRRLRNSRRDAQAANMAEGHQGDQTLAPSPPSLAYPPPTPAPRERAVRPQPAPRERAVRPQPAPRERAVRPQPAPRERAVRPEPAAREQVTRPEPAPTAHPACPEPALREQPEPALREQEVSPTPAAGAATGREVSRRRGRRNTLPGRARQRLRGRTGPSRPTTAETDRTGPARNTGSKRPGNGGASAAVRSHRAMLAVYPIPTVKYSPRNAHNSHRLAAQALNVHLRRTPKKEHPARPPPRPGIAHLSRHLPSRRQIRTALNRQD